MNDAALSIEPSPRMPANGSALDVFSGDPNFMLSLARGLLVLQTFASIGPKVTVSEAARATGLARAAVRRCLYTLCRIGYVRMDGAAFVLETRALPLLRDPGAGGATA